MNIEEYIKKEAPHCEDPDLAVSQHDRAYAMALREAYGLYQNMNLNQLLYEQRIVRMTPEGMPTHRHVAKAMLLMDLIKEKKADLR